jgi:hypothetical protein
MGSITSPTLPLEDHSLELVVENDNLDSNVKLRRGGELHRCHTKGRVSIDINDSFLWCSHFSANGCWKTETHRLENVE